MPKKLKLLPRVAETKPCVICGKPMEVYRGRFGNLIGEVKDTCSRTCENEHEMRTRFTFWG